MHLYTHLVKTFVLVTLLISKRKDQKYFVTENKAWKMLYCTASSDCIIYFIYKLYTPGWNILDRCNTAVWKKERQKHFITESHIMKMLYCTVSSDCIIKLKTIYCFGCTYIHLVEMFVLVVTLAIWNKERTKSISFLQTRPGKCYAVPLTIIKFY